MKGCERAQTYAERALNVSRIFARWSKVTNLR
jgi:hypothetical protein